MSLTSYQTAPPASMVYKSSHAHSTSWRSRKALEIIKYNILTKKAITPDKAIIIKSLFIYLNFVASTLKSAAEKSLLLA